MTATVRRYLLSALCALLLAACGPAPTTVDSAIVSQAIQNTAAPVGATRANFGPTKSVVDARSGVAFDYPADWTLLEPSTADAAIYSYSVASYDLNSPSGASEGLLTGQTKIDVTFYSDDETPESASRTVQADVDSGMAVIVKQETRTAPDGSPAYYFAVQGRLGGSAQAVYTRVNGHTMSIVAYGEGAYFENVVASLRKG